MNSRPSARGSARALAVAVVVLALLLATATFAAPRVRAEAPALRGAAIGVELCPQFVCGAATFLGYFGGDVDGRPGRGWWMIAVRHDDLPDAGADAAITGGRWSLSIGGRRSTGVVIGGLLHNNGDDTFTLDVTLGSSDTDRVALSFDGTLDHRVFPPTARGTLTTLDGAEAATGNTVRRVPPARSS